METLDQIAAVITVLALLGGTLWWLRRRGYARPAAGRGMSRRLVCAERVALGPQQSLHLVKLGNRALLVASSPSGCTLLETIPWQETVEAAEALQ